MASPAPQALNPPARESHASTAMSRARLFAAVGLVAAFNALATRVSWSLSKGLWLSLSETLGISGIIWLALGIVAALALSDAEDRPAAAGDFVGALGVVTASLLPSPALAGAILVPYAIWGLLEPRATANQRAIASILLTLTLTLVWGPLLLRVMPELLDADAKMVAWITGGLAHGNIYSSPDGASRFMVAPGCSSLNNMSLATILAVSLARYFRLRLNWQTVSAVAAASLATIAVNVGRMTMIALHPRALDYWHHGAGSVMFGWLALFAIVAVIGQATERRLRDVPR